MYLKCPNIYGIHDACISLYETIYGTLKYIPVITLCMPVDNFVVNQYPFANSLNQDEDQ